MSTKKLSADALPEIPQASWTGLVSLDSHTPITPQHFERMQDAEEYYRPTYAQHQVVHQPNAFTLATDPDALFLCLHLNMQQMNPDEIARHSLTIFNGQAPTLTTGTILTIEAGAYVEVDPVDGLQHAGISFTQRRLGCGEHILNFNATYAGNQKQLRPTQPLARLRRAK